VVLPPEAYGAWLDRKLSDPAKARALAERRVAPLELTHWKVRLLVNNAKSDGPELIEPSDESTSAG
jgi:putative SOS response-associated peptidase YedK